MKKFVPVVTTLLLLFTCTPNVQAQELALVIQAPPNITVTPITDGELDFGRVVQNQGTVRIQLQDGQTEVIRIEKNLAWWEWLWGGNRQVVVTVNSDNSLQHGTGTSTIPFSLRSAYDNQGETENKQQAQTFSNSTQFNMPPPWEEPQGNVSTAYLYIYGNINVGNDVEAGDYTGIININVTD